MRINVDTGAVNNQFENILKIIYFFFIQLNKIFTLDLFDEVFPLPNDQ